MMKASIGQGILSIPPDRKICNQLKLSGAETEGSALRYDDSSFWQDTLRKMNNTITVSYTHLRAHETPEHLVCRLLLEKKKIHTS